jgi:hypothetical protein
MIRIFLVILVLFCYKAVKAINKFDISANIGHSHIRKDKDEK